MKAQQKVYNLIILDESGSMTSIKQTIISGFNELVQSIKGIAADFPEQEQFISFVSFNSQRVNTHLDRKPVTELAELTGENYRPSAMTPLFDAVGSAVNHLRSEIQETEHVNVLVTILTDGLENHSKEYDQAAIKALVEELEKANWTFTYIGTGHDVARAATSISITNTMTFSRNEADMDRMFATEGRSRSRYMANAREGKTVSAAYYREEDEDSTSKTKS